MEKRFQVFVSSTYKDLLEHRQLVIKALLQANAIPAGMELFPAADDTAWDLIKKVIDSSDYYIVIVGGKYGSIDAKTGKSYTEMEYEYAISKRVPVLALIHAEPDKLARDRTETGALWEKLMEFRKRLMAEKHCKFWTNEQELTLAVLAGFMHAKDVYPMEGWIRGAQAKTVEDVEEKRALEHEIATLKAELSNYSSPRDGTEQFAQGDDMVLIDCTFDNGDGCTCPTTWNELLRVVGAAVAINPGLGPTTTAICKHLARTLRPNDQTFVVSLRPGQFDIIQNQFLALNYITIGTEYRQGSSPRRSNFVAFWRLTDRGQRKFAELVAIRKDS